MDHYHVVAVTTRGYHRLASYPTFNTAKCDAVQRSVRSYGIVLRDGTSGARYSIAELMSGS